jgi:hypothetical protein
MPVFRELVALSNELVGAVRDHDRARLEQLLAAEFTLSGAAGLPTARRSDAASGPYEIDDWAYERSTRDVRRTRPWSCRATAPPFRRARPLAPDARDGHLGAA